MALSPLILILALMVFGWLWGIIGLLLAVPLLVCVKIVLSKIEGMEGWARLLERRAAGIECADAFPRQRDHPGPGRHDLADRAGDPACGEHPGRLVARARAANRRTVPAGSAASLAP